MIRKQRGNNYIISLLEWSLVEYKGYWVNVCDGFNTGHTPPVNQAQVLTRHLQAHWPCCCSSFHHFHSPMSPLFLRNHAGVGHSIKAAAFGCFLPFRVSEWNNNDEIWKAFMTTTKPSFFPIWTKDKQEASASRALRDRQLTVCFWGERNEKNKKTFRLSPHKLFSLFSTRSLEWATKAQIISHNRASVSLLKAAHVYNITLKLFSQILPNSNSTEWQLLNH